MTEEWRWVVGHEGYYQVSNLGRVRGVDRVDSIGHRRRGMILAQRARPNGYLISSLWRDGQLTTALIHRLVAEAFIGPCPDGMECCHNDGNRQNNRVSNLRWGTRMDNLSDKVKHGTTNRGENNPKAKLCRLDVWLIRNCRLRPKHLVEFFDVGKSTISSIRLGKTWTEEQLT